MHRHVSVAHILIVWLCWVFQLGLADVDPIVIKGSKFFYKTNGTEFIIRGIRYAQISRNPSTNGAQFADMLGNASICARDVSSLLDLQVNVVEVDSLIPTQDHSDCMNTFAEAGIYVLVGLDNEGSDSADMAKGFWDWPLYNEFTEIVDSLADYDNVLGYSIGNTNDYFGILSPKLPFWKAAIRDVKAFMKAKNHREVPIGWTAVSYPVIKGTPHTNNGEMMEYMTCGDDTADFVGLQSYSYNSLNCTTSDTINSLAQQFDNLTIPVFVDGYGCMIPSNGKDNRTFDQLPAIYGDGNSETIFAGGVLASFYTTNVSLYSNEGLVTPSGSSLDHNAGFNAFATAISSIKFDPTNSASYTPSNTVAPSCPTLGTEWQANTTLPPTPYEKLCDCMYSQLRCVTLNNVFVTSHWVDADTEMTQLCSEAESDCTGVRANGTTGVYHAFSTCDANQTYAYISNHYWLRHSNNGTTNVTGLDGFCDMQNQAKLRDKPAGPTDECTFLLNQVGPNGEKALTNTSWPSSTIFSSTATASGSGSLSAQTGSGSTHAASAKKLSSGSIAGAAVGGFAGAIAVLASILYVLRVLKQRKKAAEKAALALDKAQQDKPELHGKDMTVLEISRHQAGGNEFPNGQGVRAEAPVAWGNRPAINMDPVEMPDNGKPAEMAGGMLTAELDGQGNVERRSWVPGDDVERGRGRIRQR